MQMPANTGVVVQTRYKDRAAEVRAQLQHFRDTGCGMDAVHLLEEAVRSDPDLPEFQWELGCSLIHAGRISEGLQWLGRVVAQVPDNPLLGSCYLRMLHYSEDLTCEDIFTAYQAWARRHAGPKKTRTHYQNDSDPGRRLRVGYISPDFFRHSVAYFFEPLLGVHNRDEVEVYGYGNVAHPDEVTVRLVNEFDHYRDIHGKSDEAVVDMIARDRIDILVDLAGHTEGNRLLVLAHKPAPIQLTYLGHPAGTGMDQVDYRVTDHEAESDRSRACYTEELILLPEGFLCYRPPEFAPDVTAAPVLQKGYVTFGSFNNNCKISSLVMRLWADILKAVPQSRLILKFRVGKDDQIRVAYLERFVQLGVAPERIDIHGPRTPVEHLALYNDVDIALDTYPYHGTTTTCEALWMGVPVISLIGQAHCCRVGLSLLRQIGLELFAASTPDEYVTKACALASQTDSLNKIRMTLRSRMSASSLCDAQGFGRRMEAVFRQTWKKWCEDAKEVR